MPERTKLAYAPDGLIGVLTPQANTTVEPEFALLCPNGIGFINARMLSPHQTIEDRLVDYVRDLDNAIDRFANAPVDVLALATTGVAYLIGPEAEDQLVDRIGAERGAQFVTTSKAVCDGLTVLGARNIGLVSPYPSSLTEKSATYWSARGFSVEVIESLHTEGDTFHPIYSMEGDRALSGAERMKTSGVDAIVLLGTGMPTLSAVSACAGWGGPPVLSSMLALIWRSALAVRAEVPGRDSLLAWLSAEAWRDRLDKATGGTH